MAIPEIPPDFTPSDPALCELVKLFGGKTAARFVVVYPVGELIAVHDGSQVVASWVKSHDEVGKRLLLALAERQVGAVMLDLEVTRCWVTERLRAVSFVGNAARSRSSTRPDADDD